MSASNKTTRTLATILREAIAQSGKSINDLARSAGVPQPVLHRFAKGERDLKLATADKLLDFFGLEVRRREPAN
jgi:plasmid maintenance system antidote protein VapI